MDPWGDEWPPPKGAGNYGDASRKEIYSNSKPGYIDGYDDSFPTTAPVMSFEPNAFGLYDLSGNAWEWVDDWYNTTQSERVFRGSSWDGGNRSNLLSSYRGHSTPEKGGAGTGFRVVLVTSASGR